MLEPMINTPPPKSEWDYPDHIIAKITIDSIAADVNYAILGARLNIHYEIDGPVIGATAPTDPWPLNKFHVPSGVTEVFLTEVVYGSPFTSFVIRSPNMTGFYWSPRFKTGSLSFSESWKLTDVSTYLPKEIKSLSMAFIGCRSFNQDISHWDTSEIVDMSEMFNSATSFNQDLSGWDVSKVTSWSGFDTNTPAWLPEYKPKFK